MDAWIWAIIAVVVVVVAALAIWQVTARQRRERLRGRFGPEYDRTLDRTAGDRRAAESELAEREKRREQLEIRPLSAAARDRYSGSWREVQALFVDEPRTAVRDADQLVISVMRERGYPMDDFEQRAADVSVDHPDVVENYRAAHRISEASERGDATTEDLRQAMRHYRALFEDLLETRSGEPVENTNSQTRSV